MCPPATATSDADTATLPRGIRKRRSRRQTGRDPYETGDDYQDTSGDEPPHLGFGDGFHPDPISFVDRAVGSGQTFSAFATPASSGTEYGTGGGFRPVIVAPSDGGVGFGEVLHAPRSSDRPMHRGATDDAVPTLVAPSGGGGGGNHHNPKGGKFMTNGTVPIHHSQAMCGNMSMIYVQVDCDPRPDAFNPCEDMMGNAGLRFAVWIVVVAAVLGNLAVMLVLMSSRFKMTVSKFLMCHLAFSDFCTGLYLLLIATMDLHTLGEYFNYAIDWQRGPGCKVAGFLTVFGSELSIFTLTVITLERWYAITYAIHLNRRLRLGTAARVMVGGWIYAMVLAVLPLVGVSGYAKTSICLPFDNENAADVAYITGLLSINGLAFLLICACYGKMYWAIGGGRRHSSAITQGDKTVAKRMALLVFTDFACWAPIAFFGLTAVAGHPLISVTNSKILLVFFYPLNSCANPFLYAIFTKQYRRDLVVMLSRYGLIAGRSNRNKPNNSSNLTHVGGCRQLGGTTGSASGPLGNHRRGSSLLTQLSDSDHHNKKRQKRHKRNGSHHSEVTTTSTTTAATPPRHTPPSPAARAARRSPSENGPRVTWPASCDEPSSPIGCQNGHHHQVSSVEMGSNRGEGECGSMGAKGWNEMWQGSAGRCKVDNRACGVPSPKTRGSPHPIKNSYTKLNTANSEHEILVLQKMQVFPENWIAKRSASLGDGAAVEVIPLKQPELFRTHHL